MDVVLLVSLFWLFSPGAIPGVNEPHYLCKAKQFWDSTFCTGDVFLESADAHFLFYLTVGWLTKVVSLPTAAIIGRVFCWTMIAIGWRMLSFALISKPLMAVLSAGLALTSITHFHFAGEWLIGGVEAKGFAYAFLLAGLSFLVQKKWPPVWALFGIAAAFHVIIGGWGIVVAGFTWLFSFGNRGSWKGNLICLTIGFAFSLIGLVPALLLTVGHPPEIVSQANQIYTFERIAHHLLFSHIFLTTPSRFDFFVVATLIWTVGFCVTTDDKCLRMFNIFVLGALLIALIAVCIDCFTIHNLPAGEGPGLHFAAKWLRYYWFRLSDVFIPTGIALIMTVLLMRFFYVSYNGGAIALTLVVGIVLSQLIWIQFQKQADQRSHADQLTLPSFGNSWQSSFSRSINMKTYQDWIDVCCWIRESTVPDARFITPRKQSTFKWYAHRSEIVSWKDVPQDSAGIVDWKRRFDHVFKFDTLQFGLATWNAEQRLLDLGKQYQAQFVVMERRHVRNRKQYLEALIEFAQLQNEAFSGVQLPLKKPLFLKLVYPNSGSSPEIRRDSTYLVYELVVPAGYQQSLQTLEGFFRSAAMR